MVTEHVKKKQLLCLKLMSSALAFFTAQRARLWVEWQERQKSDGYD
jgi:hypothetical protein